MKMKNKETKSTKEIVESVLEKNSGKSFNEVFFKVIEAIDPEAKKCDRELKKICTGKDFPSFATIAKYMRS
jgi:hypothetical protein